LHLLNIIDAVERPKCRVTIDVARPVAFLVVRGTSVSETKV